MQVVRQAARTTYLRACSFPTLADCYTCLTNKTRAFLLAAVREYPNVEWVGWQP